MTTKSEGDTPEGVQPVWALDPSKVGKLVGNAERRLLADARKGNGMFCPEDGNHIPLPAHPGSGGLVTYAPCPHCGTIWEYDGETGQYVNPSAPGTPAKEGES